MSNKSKLLFFLVIATIVSLVPFFLLTDERSSTKQSSSSESRSVEPGDASATERSSSSESRSVGSDGSIADEMSKCRKVARILRETCEHRRRPGAVVLAALEHYKDERLIGRGGFGLDVKVSWSKVETLREEVLAISHVLRKRGLRVGDRLVSIGQNVGWEPLVLFLASLVCGFTFVAFAPYFEPEAVVETLASWESTRYAIFAQRPSMLAAIDSAPEIKSVALVQLPSGYALQNENAAGSEKYEEFRSAGKNADLVSLQETEKDTNHAVFSNRSSPSEEPDVMISVRSDETGSPKAVRRSLSNNLDLLCSRPLCATQFSPMIVVSPFFSPDHLAYAQFLLAGQRFVMLRSTSADVAAFAPEIAPNVLFFNPHQLWPVLQAFQQEFEVDNQTAKLRWEQMGKSIAAIAVGGGAPVPGDVDVLRRALPSVMDVVELWGCAEAGSIGSGRVGEQMTLDASIRSWDLQDIGPFRREKGEGELLVAKADTESGGIYVERSLDETKKVKTAQGTFYRTHNIVHLVSGKIGAKKARVVRLGRVTGLIQSASGQWISPDRVEMALLQGDEGEGGDKVLRRVFVHGSNRTDKVVVVCSLTSEAQHWSNEAVLSHVRKKLQNFTAPDNRVDAVLLANESWEYRPRNKVRRQILERFRRELADAHSLAPSDLGPGVAFREPTAAELAFAVGGSPDSVRWVWRSSHLAILQNEFFIHEVRRLLGLPAPDCRLIARAGTLTCALAAGTAGVAAVAEDDAREFVLDALLGCTAPPSARRMPAGAAAGGATAPPRFLSCLLRDDAGGLREPERTGRPFHPAKLSLPERLQRFDDVAWQLWDLRAAAAGSGPYGGLRGDEVKRELERLRKVDFMGMLDARVPDYLPSLGCLQQLGVRLRKRLANAFIVLDRAPHLLEEPNAAAAYHAGAAALLLQPQTAPPTE
eukprot:TRINITY_DN23007_c0_g2_i1.p1 TRINITY_DN23007_c0_g2~~TRINITY_DN23007_c0_g2_i1.p1  ORF type:complete len:946 (-),score=178.48 TRINITY_DN23007_c0_g2_i1:45-2828(-)